MKDRIFKYTTMAAGMLSIVFLFGIIFSIFKEGYPIFIETGVFKFIFGRSWHPTHYPAEFGIWPLILGSITATIGALMVALPLGIGTAVYLSEIAHPNIREMLKPLVELLASIPSVIFGLFGMALLAPVVRRVFNIPIGLNLFTVSIVLGIMIVPIISSISEDALSSVSHSLREASYALGATRIDTIFRVVLPAARSGVMASVLLGFGRAIGETMVVLMVAGGSAMIPKSIFSPIRPMTSAIASEMGETVMGSPHYQALFGIAIVLFLITFVSNIVTQVFIKRAIRKGR